MKTLLYAFFLIPVLTLWSFQAYAKKEFCITVKPNAKVFRQSDKKKVQIETGSRFIPIRKNKKKTYILFKKNSAYHWINIAGVKITKEDKCEKLKPTKEYFSNKPDEIKEKVQSAPTTKVPFFKKIQFRIGYSIAGDESVGDGFITNVSNPNDVRRDQSPIIQNVNFVSSFELTGSYLRPLGSGLLRGSLGFRTTELELEGKKNLDPNNGGIALPESSLTQVATEKLTYNSGHLLAEYGRVLKQNSVLKLTGYLGVDLGYRLSDSESIDVFTCSADGSCPLKRTNGSRSATWDQFVATPTLAVEIEYRNFLLLGLGLDMNYLPTFRIGATF